MKKKRRKKKIEFSKIMAGLMAFALLGYAIWSGIEYYVLTKLAIENASEYVTPATPDIGLAVVCVTSILGVFVSYCLYQFGLKNSLNKHDLTIDEKTGMVRHLMNQESTEIIEDMVKLDSEDEQEDTNKLNAVG